MFTRVTCDATLLHSGDLLVLGVLIGKPASAALCSHCRLARAAGILGTFGDLFESFIKRACGLKDIGTLLPGETVRAASARIVTRTSIAVTVPRRLGRIARSHGRSRLHVSDCVLLLAVAIRATGRAGACSCCKRRVRVFLGAELKASRAELAIASLADSPIRRSRFPNMRCSGTSSARVAFRVVLSREH